MKRLALILTLLCPILYITSYAQNSEAKAEGKRPFTISAAIREEYDDNIFTSATSKDASMKTILEPSILFNYPKDATLLSARYTFGATAFHDRDKTFDFSHEFLGRINHSFSERFNLDVRNRFRLAQEPEVANGAVVARVAGDYLNNTFTTQGSMQWTPKFSTVSTFTNDYYDYDTAAQSTNDRMSNTLSNDFRFLVLPTTTLVLGASYTNMDYFKDIVGQQTRDWQSFSPYVGVDYALTPSLTLSPRLGVTYTAYDSSQASDGLTPYAGFTVDWKIGARSSLTFGYNHTVAQTDVNGFSAQETDALSLTGRYQLTPLILTRATMFYNMGTNESDAAVIAGTRDTKENTLGLDLGASYEINKMWSVEGGYIYNQVDSDVAGREYERNRVYLGARFTY